MKPDWGSIIYSILFMALGAYLAFFWPRSIRKKIDEGQESAESEGMIRWMVPIGAVLLLYCFGDLAWTLYKSLFSK